MNTELTENYYENNADLFFENTLNIDMSELYALFLPYLKSGASILDLGCGSGRDSRCFMELGYDVTPLEPGMKLADLAETYLKTKVDRYKVQELPYQEKFDAVWACATLLHLPFSEMELALTKLYQALKPNGIIFISLKKGEFDGERNGRYFCDYTLSKFEQTNFIEIGFELVHHSESIDKRPGRESEKWLNLVLRKK